MKAVVHDRYGGPDVLRVEDVPVPSPGSGQVRVRVRATSLNLSDWEALTGSPAYARFGGLRRPTRRTLGSDIAGVVDEVGEGVTRFRPGDEVYGDNLALMGGFAEYAVAAESSLAAQAGRAHLRRGVDHPAGGRDRAEGDHVGRARATRARQRCRRRVGRLRDPARQTARRPCHRRGQRRQARLHALGRRGRGRRLPVSATSPGSPLASTWCWISSPTARSSPTVAHSHAAAPTAASAARSARCSACSPWAGRPADSPVGRSGS